MRRPRSVSPRVTALIIAGVLTGSACSGRGGPTIAVDSPSPTPGTTSAGTAPSGGPSSATPSSTSPGGAATAQPGGGKLSAWKACGHGFQCATLTVAQDAAKPSAGTVDLALTRHRATGSRRVGSLLFNPGGPGVSAVDRLQGGYTGFPQTVREHFDLVAFDPRGVGHTTPVRCQSTAELDAYFHVDSAPDNDAELKTFDAANKKFAQGCQTRSAAVLPYVSTTIVAQDMDRVRAALGEAKLTYLGYSYGTSIGAAYLDQFPTHVRAMVLDGAVDPTLTWDQLLSGQARGFDVALRAFLDDCQKTSCAFRKAVKGDLNQAYDALSAHVDKQPLPGAGNRTVGPAEFLTGVALGLYSRSFWPTIGIALAHAAAGNGDVLLALNDDYLERTPKGYSNLLEANNAVNCIDRPWPRTDAPYLALAKQVGKQYPRFGPAIALSGGVCEFWPLPPSSTPHPVAGNGSPPIIVIGTTRDPATPYSWAQSLAKQLTHGVLLTHVGDGHTAYRTGAPTCLTQPVNDYFISLKAPVAATC